jgi:hypothetical protein
MTSMDDGKPTTVRPFSVFTNPTPNVRRVRA